MPPTGARLCRVSCDGTSVSTFVCPKADRSRPDRHRQQVPLRRIRRVTTCSARCIATQSCALRMTMIAPGVKTCVQCHATSSNPDLEPKAQDLCYQYRLPVTARVRLMNLNSTCYKLWTVGEQSGNSPTLKPGTSLT